MQPRANGQAICPACERPGPGYDRLPPRRFEFVPLWGMKVFLVYAPRRVDCPRCGVKVESMPWGMGKHPLTQAYAWFLATRAKRLSWQEVAEVFHMSWDAVFGFGFVPIMRCKLLSMSQGKRSAGEEPAIAA